MRERSIHTHKSHTMGSKQPEPWSPRWVREKLREFNNGLPPNDPNHDSEPSAGAELPLCKCKFECASHYSLDYDMYNRRYWSCPSHTSPFNWGWNEEKSRKVVLVLTFTVAINNVVINHVIFL
jgi:hypothetical protein